MKVHNYLETEAIEDAPGVLRRVVVGADDGAPRFTMRVFEVRSGCATPFLPLVGTRGLCSVR